MQDPNTPFGKPHEPLRPVDFCMSISSDRRYPTRHLRTMGSCCGSCLRWLNCHLLDTLVGFDRLDVTEQLLLFWADLLRSDPDFENARKLRDEFQETRLLLQQARRRRHQTLKLLEDATSALKDCDQMVKLLEDTADQMAETVTKTFPELPFRGPAVQVLKEATETYRGLLEGQFRGDSSALSLITQRLDVDRISRNLSETPSEAPIFLRAIFFVNAAKALELLDVLDENQREEIREQVKRTEEREDYSPLHVRPHSLASLVFAEFLSQHDQELENWWEVYKGKLSSKTVSVVTGISAPYGLLK